MCAAGSEQAGWGEALLWLMLPAQSARAFLTASPWERRPTSGGIGSDSKKEVEGWELSIYTPGLIDTAASDRTSGFRGLIR